MKASIKVTIETLEDCNPFHWRAIFYRNGKPDNTVDTPRLWGLLSAIGDGLEDQKERQ